MVSRNPKVQEMLTEHEKIVLIALYYACKGSTKANVGYQYIRKKIPKQYWMTISIEKTLRKLEKKGLIWTHYGRRANGGKTYGITKEGIKYLKQNKLI